MLFHSFDECALEQLAADTHMDELRNLADEMEARELFLSEATAQARSQPTDEQIDADYRRVLAEYFLAPLAM